MTISIKNLNVADLDAVDNLMKQYSKTLGFLPKEALRDYLEKGYTLGVKNDDSQLVGYLLSMNYPSYFRIAHLCVVEGFRGQNIAKRLIEELKNSATTQKVIDLRCRNDFPAHKMWPKLGFAAIDEKPGRSRDKCPLTLWRLPLAPDDQLDLVQATLSDDSLNVVIDAMIFFDFYDEADSDKSVSSKALFSDFLGDKINILITDEMFNEINRKEDLKQREKSRVRAHESQKIVHDPTLAEHFEDKLKTFLPSDTPNRESDIRHLAKTAASEAKIFITQDQALLKRSTEIEEQVSVQVMPPTQLIIQLHELSEKQSYTPTRIIGLELNWQRLSSERIAHFPYNFFLNQGEKKSAFRQKLNTFLADPHRYQVECLQSRDKEVAVRAFITESNKTLTVPQMRLAQSMDDRSLFGRFVIADTIAKAVSKNLDMVEINRTGLTLGLEPDLFDMGFIGGSESFVRFCFPCCLTRKDVLSRIRHLFPDLLDNYQSMLELTLQKSCSPLNLKEIDQSYFLIPIRPGYAKSLVDTQEAAGDMFVQNPKVLLGWENVYYKIKSHHRMLQAPGRILWYASGKAAKQIVAISYLDAVEIGDAKSLFRKYKKYGVLEWRDIFNICNGNPSKEIMALRFSHTFAFRKLIPLDAMREAFREHDSPLVLRSPSKVKTELFCELLQLGYPD